jgi:hypothetical protein
MFFMLGSSNPFALNPFRNGTKLIPISPLPKELEKRKYHGECNECGANVDAISIRCSECNHAYCKLCASTETGICDKCTKIGARRSANKNKASGRPRSSDGEDGGSDGDGSNSTTDNGGDKPIPRFKQSWGDTNKG